MTTNGEPICSNLAIPPGETIAENIEILGVPLHQLAESLSLPVGAVEEIIRGERAIIPDVAVGLEAALGIPAQLWLNLEVRYRTTLARNWEKTGGKKGKKEEWTDWRFGRLLRKHQHEDAADRAAV